MIDKKLIPAGVLKHDPETAAFLLGNAPPADPPRSALQIHREAVGADPGELIRSRFLCRGGVAMIAGETAAGKSSLILQIATAWGMGRPVFGLEPVRPLRTLIYQAENDDFDLAEEIRGQIHGWTGRGVDRREVEKGLAAVEIVCDRSHAGDSFIAELEAVLKAAESKFDVVFVDPLFGFAGVDLIDQAAVSSFLRNRLNPLVERYGVALVLTHHKVKSSKNTATNRDYNQSYDFFGSAELANFPRAIMILDRYTDDAGEHFFSLRAPKRGTRLGWPEKEVYMRWAKDCIFWEELQEKPASAAGCYSADPATRRQQREAADRARLEDEVAAAVDLLEPGQAASITDLRGAIRGAGITMKTDRVNTILETAICRGLLTKRAPDPARGEGGRGVHVMLERPAPPPEKGGAERTLTL